MTAVFSKIQDLNRIIWNNVERISSLLRVAIEKAASTGPYEWWAGRTLQEIEALAHGDRKRLLFLAARQAGEDKYEPLVRYRELAREALAFWREYWARAVNGGALRARVTRPRPRRQARCTVDGGDDPGFGESRKVDRQFQLSGPTGRLLPRMPGSHALAP
jgi:hypothetical protein